MRVSWRSVTTPSSGAIPDPIVRIYHQQVEVKPFFTKEISIPAAERQETCQVGGTEVFDDQRFQSRYLEGTEAQRRQEVDLGIVLAAEIMDAEGNRAGFAVNLSVCG